MSGYHEHMSYIPVENGLVWTRHVTQGGVEQHTRLLFYSTGKLIVTFGTREGKRCQFKPQIEISTPPFSISYDPEKGHLITNDPSDTIILISDYNFSLEWFGPVHSQHPRSRAMEQFFKQWR